MIFADETESRLVENAKNGDSGAARQIYDCYANYLTAVCARYLSDDAEMKDVLQDALVKIFTSLKSFEYRGAGSLKAWMRQVCVNEALHHIRSKKGKGQTVSLDWERFDEKEADEPEEEPDIGGLPPGLLQKMIRELPDGYREVFNLYVFEEMSHKDIAAALGISASTSASQFFRARAWLARRIREYRHKNGNDNGKRLVKKS